MGSSINTIIFSYNRACQLDLLLRSLNFSATVFYKYDPEFEAGYKKLFALHPDHEYIKQVPFRKKLNVLAGRTEFVSFLNDDCVMVEHYDQDEVVEGMKDPLVISFGLGLHSGVAGTKWDWKDYANHPDWRMWGFPMSVDSCIVRSSDVLPIMENEDFDSVPALEKLLKDNLPPRPKMMCFENKKVINWVMNTVQTQHRRPRDRVPPAELEARWLAGERLSLEAIKRKTRNSPLYRVGRRAPVYET